MSRMAIDLKGKPIEKLTKLSESGIQVHPVYTADDLPDGVDKSFPGMDDLRRGEQPLMRSEEGGWLIAQDYSRASVADFPAFAEQVMSRGWKGRRAVRLVLDSGLRNAMAPGDEPSGTGGLLIQDWQDLEPIVQWASEASVQLHLSAGDAALDFMTSEMLQRITGGIDLNPLRFLPGRPAEGDGLSSLLAQVAQAILSSPIGHEFRVFTLSLQEIELAGASAVQQMAFALAMATDLADRLGRHGLEPKAVFSRTSFQFPISTDFFGEISKLRAFRVLWGRVLEAWGLDARDPVFTHIQAVPATSTETIADSHVNLLRHTTQAMAAGIGGCAMISLPAHDGQFTESGMDAVRIARNIQLILQEESHVGRVVDAAGGAYYVEKLTDELAAKSWSLFQSIESEGGWHSFIGRDMLPPLLAEGRKRRMDAVNSGARSVLGSNLFPNGQDRIHPPRTADIPGCRATAIVERLRRLGETLGIHSMALPGFRLATGFEAIRLRKQELEARKTGIGPVLLLTFGDHVMRTARANFSRNVFGSGGFHCEENLHPSGMELSVAYARALNPSVVVFCGSDADYRDSGPAWLDAMVAALPAARYILAGQPEGWEVLQGHGIAEAIYAGMDRTAFLENLLQALELGKEVQE
ncbi:MAG: Methylmalonyl-COA mutase [Bacteroidota bacterium]